MNHTRRVFELVAGDVAAFYLSLYIALFLRRLEAPSIEVFWEHVLPFSLLFVLWAVIFTIAGLYDRRTALFRERIPSLIILSQAVNVGLAAAFFFTTSIFAIAPKTTLLIYLVVSSALIIFWRLTLAPRIGPRSIERAVLIGRGREVEELYAEVNAHTSFGFAFVERFGASDVAYSAALEGEIATYFKKARVGIVVVDFRDSTLGALSGALYRVMLAHPDLVFVDAAELYEEVFGRIPISMLDDGWFLENITARPYVFYDFFHRVFDIAVTLLLTPFALLLAPAIALAIMLDDGGSVFSFQKRVGKYGRPLFLVKFRTMTLANDGGAWESVPNKITRVGAFLRKSRLDELPQLWNVLLGGYSLIGPRPEMPPAVETYARTIPYYHARHLITPGLSGWAQIHHDKHPHVKTDVEETRNKLSFDLYYLKNRSITLDLYIGLKTIKTLLSRSGS